MTSQPYDNRIHNRQWLVSVLLTCYRYRFSWYHGSNPPVLVVFALNVACGLAGDNLVLFTHPSTILSDLFVLKRTECLSDY